MLRIARLILISLLALFLFSGCTNQGAARVGNRIGKVLGKPLGVIATAGDEAFRETGAIVKENVQHHRELRRNQQQAELQTTTTEVPEQSHPGQIDSVKESKRISPQIELLSQQQTKNHADFWQ